MGRRIKRIGYGIIVSLFVYSCIFGLHYKHYDVNIHIFTNIKHQESSHISQGIESKELSSHGHTAGHQQIAVYKEAKAEVGSHPVVPSQDKGGGTRKKDVPVSKNTANQG